MANANPFAKAIAAAAEIEDHNVAQTGGGDFQPFPEGPVRLRLFAYIETGEHDGEFNGKAKVIQPVHLGFEISGPKIKEVLGDREDGQPYTIWLELNKSLSDKSGFYKLFKAMNYEGDAKVFADMLGRDFLGTIVHQKSKKDPNKVYAVLKKPDGGFTISPPWFDNPATGDRTMCPAPELRSAMQCFLWNYADKAQWDSIFIDGEWEAKPAEDGRPAREAKSKNRWQIKIKEAKNFRGSLAQDLVLDGIDVGGIEDAKRGAVNPDAAGDPLANVAF
jgi:hypothetical protein